jgi:hypothetical protein
LRKNGGAFSRTEGLLSPESGVGRGQNCERKLGKFQFNIFLKSEEINFMRWRERSFSEQRLDLGNELCCHQKFFTLLGSCFSLALVLPHNFFWRQNESSGEGSDDPTRNI